MVTYKLMILNCAFCVDVIYEHHSISPLFQLHKSEIRHW